MQKIWFLQFPFQEIDKGEFKKVMYVCMYVLEPQNKSGKSHIISLNAVPMQS